MKKIIALMLAAVLLCTAAVSLAEQESVPLLDLVNMMTNPDGFSYSTEAREGYEGNGDAVPEEDRSVHPAVDSMRQFFNFWASGAYEDMLKYCTSEWKDRTEEPAKMLEEVLSIAKPLEFRCLEIAGIEIDTQRTLRIETRLGRTENGKGPKEIIWQSDVPIIEEADGEWRVNPENIYMMIGSFMYDEGQDPLARLEAFMDAWEMNEMGRMLELCSPSWQGKQENPRHGLFAIIGARVPLEYSFKDVEDMGPNGIRVTTEAQIDKNNGNQPAVYLLEIDLKREADRKWYVDPESIRSREPDTPQKGITAEACVKGFFDAWKSMNIDRMLEFCSPAWKAEQVNPQVSLLMLMGNGTLLQYTVDEIQGPGDGRPLAVWPMLTVMMDFSSIGTQEKLDASLTVKQEEDGKWYVDPESLKWQ